MHTTRILTILQKLLLAVACLVLITGVVAPSVINAVTEEDLKSVEFGTEFYDPTEPCGVSSTTAAQSTGSPAGGVYVLGDSIGVGVTPPLTGALPATEGWVVSGDSVVGRTLTQGIAVARNPTQQLRDAKAVVVILGTNNITSASNSADIATMATTIKAANSAANIYWLEVNVTRNDLVAGAETYNKFLAATPGVNILSNTATIGGDGIHPSDYTKLAAEVAAGIKGNSNQTPVSVGGCVCSASSSANLSGSDNVQKAFNFFLGKGLTPIQSAGILGNMQAESGVDPENIQEPGGRTRDPTPLTTRSQGWGIIQWTPGAKIIGLLQGAGITTPVYELGTQLEMVWWHMNNIAPPGGRNIIEAFKQTTTIEQAVAVFEDKMERPQVSGNPIRIRYANDVLKLYGGSSGGGGGVSVSSGSCSDVSGAGQDTKFIDGFTVYNQNDRAWRNTPYSTSTIGVSGCGPAAMAMIITNLTGKQVTPVETSKYAAEKGLYIAGQGSSWDIGPVLAEHWGLKAQNIGVNLEAITKTLQAGGLVITAGQGAEPFTSGGHFIVIRGITAEGKFKVGDSGHSDTSDKEWDAQQILASMRGRDGSVYAITK